jgi:DNA primase
LRPVCSQQQYFRGVKLPSNYFLNRGFTKEVLNKFHVGSYIGPHKYFTGRSLVPIFNAEGRQIVGLSGRLESEDYDKTIPKWKHTENFPSGQILYNIWSAKEFIRQSRIAIIVEGPGDVWRLEEAGFYNAVALLGGVFSPAKHFQLDRAGCMTILVLTDPNQAGNNYAKIISTEYSRFYNIKRIEIPTEYKDIGEMPLTSIKNLL